MFEVWAFRVYKELSEDADISEMKDTDKHSVCQLEYPYPEKGFGGSAAAASAASSTQSSSCSALSLVPNSVPAGEESSANGVAVGATKPGEITTVYALLFLV